MSTRDRAPPSAGVGDSRRGRADSSSGKSAPLGTGYEALGASISTIIFSLLALNLSLGTIAFFAVSALAALWWLTKGRISQVPSKRPRVESNTGRRMVFTVGGIEDGEASFSVSEDDNNMLMSYSRWIRNVLEKSNKSLGRSGPVCPFVPRALRLDTIHISLQHTNAQGPISVQSLQDVAMESQKAFTSIRKSFDAARVSVCLVVVFPDLTSPPAHEVPRRLQALNEVVRRLLPDFVQNGLMISSFSPQDETPGVHNRLFHPRQAPYASLLIRTMTKEDLVFLSATGLHPRTVAAMMNSYLKVMGPELDANRREAAMSFIAQANAASEGQEKKNTGGEITGRLRSYSAELNQEDIEDADHSQHTSPLLNPVSNIADTVMSNNRLEL